jgi:hypothetical protein
MLHQWQLVLHSAVALTVLGAAPTFSAQRGEIR